MAITANNTTLTFNDASTQTTSAVTSVSAGTGISVAGGKTPTVTNTGVTSVAAGTGISVSASTGGVTITNTSSASGTVTSVATGNGLSGGTITSTGTLVIACPGFNTVGSYIFAGMDINGTQTAGQNYAAGGGNLQTGLTSIINGDQSGVNGSISGTWKWMARGISGGGVQNFGIACRVS
jgi:hypothetical protein